MKLKMFHKNDISEERNQTSPNKLSNQQVSSWHTRAFYAPYSALGSEQK